MKDLFKFQKVNKHLVLISIFLFTTCSGGCASDRIEYDPPDSNLVGKVIHFKEPMAYITLSDKKKFGFDFVKIEGKKVMRAVMFRNSVDDKNSVFHEYPEEDIKDGMAFIILSSYWNRGNWFTREFAPDVQNAILKDENGIISICSMRIIKSVYTDYK